MQNTPDEFVEYESPDQDTIVKIFQKKVEENPNYECLAYRDNSQEGRPYVWKKRKEVWDTAHLVSRGIDKLGLVSHQEFDGEKWKFFGIMAKNRPEWFEMQLACLLNSLTIPAFYVTLGHEGCRFILEQTQLTTVAVQEDYIKIFA